MTRRGIVSFVTITNGVYRPDARANGSRAAGPCRESSIRPAAFAPVGEPGRARIALVVREIGKGCVRDIAERLELKISLVFNHMRAFADHDLAEKRSVGKFVCLSRQSGGRRSWQECECASSDGSFRHAGRRASTGQSCSESSTGGRGYAWTSWCESQQASGRMAPVAASRSSHARRRAFRLRLSPTRGTGGASCSFRHQTNWCASDQIGSGRHDHSCCRECFAVASRSRGRSTRAESSAWLMCLGGFISCPRL